MAEAFVFMTNSIRFYKPSDALKRYVRFYYIAEFNGDDVCHAFEHRHLSDGCVEMFINYHNTMEMRIDDHGSSVHFNAAVVGAHDLVNNIMGRVLQPSDKCLKFVSVNFTFNGFYEVFKISPAEVYNGFFSAHDVLGDSIKIIQEKLSVAKDHPGRIEVIEFYLKSILEKRDFSKCSLKNGIRIASYINENNSRRVLKDVMHQMKSSERSMQRDFKATFGFTIKEYCKILRFCRLINDIDMCTQVDWSDMVSKYGYYDQSHLINEFRNATGISPLVYTKRLNKDIFKLFNHLALFKSLQENSNICDAIRLESRVLSGQSAEENDI